MSLGKLLLYSVYENLLCRYSTAELCAQGWAGTTAVLDHLVQLLHDVEFLVSPSFQNNFMFHDFHISWYRSLFIIDPLKSLGEN